MNFENMCLDHVGIRVRDLAVAERFYAKLGFTRDPDEFSLEPGPAGLDVQKQRF